MNNRRTEYRRDEDGMQGRCNSAQLSKRWTGMGDACGGVTRILGKILGNTPHSIPGLVYCINNVPFACSGNCWVTQNGQFGQICGTGQRELLSLGSFLGRSDIVSVTPG